MRFGIDASCLGSRRGYGRFLRELLPRLVAVDASHEYVLFADCHTRVDLGDVDVRVVRPETTASQLQAASARGHRSLRDLWTMGRAVAREALDAFYFPSVSSYFPVFGGLPVLVGLHDIIPERHGRVVFPSRQARALWRAKSWLARRQARAVVTVSSWSQAAISEWFGLARERIFVAVEAPAAIFQPVEDASACHAWLAAHGRPRSPYLLYVGGFNPHKNLARLVEALAALAPRTPALHLVLVGDYSGDPFYSDVPALRQQIQRSGMEARVHFAGYVEDAVLRHLYAGALALALPSLEEGFGLPAIEAAACGTPCVATRCSPLPELLAGGGLFVDPGSTAELRSALERVVGEPGLRAELGARALERARGLTWEGTARATREALEAVARSGASAT